MNMKDIKEWQFYFSYIWTLFFLKVNIRIFQYSVQKLNECTNFKVSTPINIPTPHKNNTDRNSLTTQLHFLYVQTVIEHS